MKTPMARCGPAVTADHCAALAHAAVPIGRAVSGPLDRPVQHGPPTLKPCPQLIPPGREPPVASSRLPTEGLPARCWPNRRDRKDCRGSTVTARLYALPRDAVASASALLRQVRHRAPALVLLGRGEALNR